MKGSDYTNIISITATILLCAGIISQTVYYFFFNIPITEFLSISEIILLFTQDIIRYILIALLILFVAIIFNYNRGSLNQKRFLVDYFNTRSINSRIIKYIDKNIGLLVYIIFGLIILYTLFNTNSKTAYLFLLYFSIEIFYIILRFFILEHKRDLRLRGQLKKEDRNFEISFSFVLHFVTFVIVWSLVDVQKVKYEKKYINVSFTHSGELITSDSSKYYIGQTDKYLFYYNSLLDKTTVYKKDNINEIIYGDINYFGDKIKHPKDSVGE